eukprot:g13667.t1
MEVARELNRVVRAASDLRNDFVEGSDFVKNNTEATVKQSNKSITDAKNAVDTLSAKFASSGTLEAAGIFELERLSENEKGKLESRAYIDLFLALQSKKISKRYKAYHCSVESKELYCDIIVRYFCELVHDTLAHICDDQNENKKQELHRFEKWVYEKEIPSLVKFIQKEFLCKEEIYKSNMACINNTWDFKLLLFHGIEGTTDIEQSLTQRGQLFKYIFGIHKISKACSIVNIVMSELASFEMDVISAATGRRNTDMTNTCVATLWEPIIDSYTIFAKDFQCIFWKTIMDIEMFNIMENIPIYTFHGRTMEKDKHEVKSSVRDSVTCIPSCVLLFEASKEILRLLCSFEDNGVDSIMDFKSYVASVKERSEHTKDDPLVNQISSILTPSIMQDTAGTVESLLMIWFQTVVGCLDSIRGRLVDPTSDSMTQSISHATTSEFPSEHVEVSKRLKIYFSIKWTTQKMVEMVDALNEHRARTNKKRDNIEVSRVIKDFENQFFRSTVCNFTLEIIRELCEYHLALDLFTYSTMPDAEFVAIKTEIDSGQDAKAFKEKIIDEGQFHRAVPSGLMIASLQWFRDVRNSIVDLVSVSSGGSGQSIMHDVLLETFQLMQNHPSWQNLNATNLGSETELNSLQERLLLDGHLLLYSVLEESISTIETETGRGAGSRKGKSYYATIDAAKGFFQKCKELSPSQSYFWETKDPAWFKTLPDFYHAVDCDEL